MCWCTEISQCPSFYEVWCMGPRFDASPRAIPGCIPEKAAHSGPQIEFMVWSAQPESECPGCDSSFVRATAEQDAKHSDGTSKAGQESPIHPDTDADGDLDSGSMDVDTTGLSLPSKPLSQTPASGRTDLQEGDDRMLKKLKSVQPVDARNGEKIDTHMANMMESILHLDQYRDKSGHACLNDFWPL